MTQFTLAVTQAPHASWYNGGKAADARQYWLRPTQHTPTGPRIDAIVAGMAANEVRLIRDTPGGIFTSRSPDNGATYSTLDWTPKNVWHSGTQQLIHGGMRLMNKISIYSDVTGEWREEAMPREMAGYQQYGHWYDRTAIEGDTVWLQGHAYDTYAGRFAGKWATKPSIGANGSIATYAWFPEAGSAGALLTHGGDAQKIQLYDTALQTWSAAFGPTGNGLHAICCHHPMHGKVLLAGGTNTANVVNLISPDGSFVRVADCPADVSMSGGADSSMLAHASGCWLVTSTTPAPRRLWAYWPDTNEWTDEGVAPDNGGDKYPTYSWDADRGLFYFVDLTGFYAWKPPAITAPSSGLSLTVQSALHAHEATVPSLAAELLLTVGDAGHAHSAAAPSLAAELLLAVVDALHTHSAESPTLDTGSTLAPADALHVHSAEGLTLGAAIDLTVASVLHAHEAAVPSLTAALALAINNTLHAHAVGNLDLATGSALAVNSALHAHSAGGLALSAALDLTAASALHGHTAVNPPLLAALTLAVNNTLHGHGAASPALSTGLVATIDNALHTHTATSPALAAAMNLLVANARHGHSADVLGLSAALQLVVVDALHAQLASSPAPVLGVGLTVDDALHAHGADVVALSGGLALTVSDALHAHRADPLALAATLELAVADALHAHRGDTITWPEVLAANLLRVVSVYVQLLSAEGVVHLAPDDAVVHLAPDDAVVQVANSQNYARGLH